MTKILITGKDSYIGTSFEKWVSQWPDEYHVTTIDVRDDSWKNRDFSNYDVIFHTAGLAHSTPKKRDKDKYYKVNTQLTYDIANKAKIDGVKQFIFMSSIIVYNSKSREINNLKKPEPDNFYGDSKLKAEEKILNLVENNFIVSIIRSPMVYGPNSKGNFKKMLYLSKYFFVIPMIKNKRSIIYIDNLIAFIKILVDRHLGNIFYPQNKEYFSFCNSVKHIRELLGKKSIYSKILIIPVYFFMKISKLANKLFGDFYYTIELSESSGINLEDYNIVNFSDSLIITIEKILKYSK